MTSSMVVEAVYGPRGDISSALRLLFLVCNRRYVSLQLLQSLVRGSGKASHGIPVDIR
jgi:hypothetical protein